MKQLLLILTTSILLTSCGGGGTSSYVNDGKGSMNDEQHFLIRNYGEPEKIDRIDKNTEIYWWYSQGFANKFISTPDNEDKCILYGMTFEVGTKPEVFIIMQ